MADQISIILNNVGNNIYQQSQREFLSSPVIADMMRVILNNSSQLSNIIKIRSTKSFGSQSNRDISLLNYVDAKNKTNLIIDVPLVPRLLLDGTTSVQMDIAANTEIDLLFYIDQVNQGGLLT